MNVLWLLKWKLGKVILVQIQTVRAWGPSLQAGDQTFSDNIIKKQHPQRPNVDPFLYNAGTIFSEYQFLE